MSPNKQSRKKSEDEMKESMFSDYMNRNNEMINNFVNILFSILY